ncbi:hypothetical protein VV01_11855 [Luteipulveratus halotolerans]|uniref:Uncharacterized protein n=1 Tax=Luteipulveratus halotolerans TaxID=1631356 RepID=A0A0L6CJI6_9MICO|nr:hypothetical protein VV01_11855 [Luteipulveratus halotolerans]
MDALLCLVLGAATILVGWLTGRLYVVVLGLLLMVPGLLLLALDQLNGGHPALALPLEEDDDVDDLDDDESSLFDDGHPLRAQPANPAGPTTSRGATRVGTDDDPTEVYQPRGR